MRSGEPPDDGAGRTAQRSVVFAVFTCARVVRTTARLAGPPPRLSSVVPRIRQAIETARILAPALTACIAHVGFAHFGYSGATFVIASPLSESAV